MAKAKPKVGSKGKRAAPPGKRGKSAARSAAAAPSTDWRLGTLARVRALILEADPRIIEERKWRKPSNPSGVPTWSHDGIVCTGESYQKAVKLTFAHGASLPDPSRLFNAGLDGNVRRAIDLHEGASIDEAAFKVLVQAAVARNKAGKKS